MNKRRLIEALLATGREIHPVPDDVRQRIFTRVLAVAATEPPRRSRAGLHRTCHTCRRRRLVRRAASKQRPVFMFQVSHARPRSEGRQSGASHRLD